MAVLWVGAVVFLVLLFVFAVPARNAGGGGQVGYANRTVTYVVPPEVPPAYSSQTPYTQMQDRTGCRQALVLVFAVFVLFAAVVVFWSIQVQAGWGF